MTFTDITLIMEARDKDTPWINKYVTVQCAKEVVLGAKETRMVSVQRSRDFRNPCLMFDVM